MQRTTAMAAHATPELHHMFEEWMGALESETLEKLGTDGEMDAAALAAALGISEEGAVYLMTQLAKHGKVSVRAKAVP